MSDSLTPTEGARFQLERESSAAADAPSARYRTSIFTPSATYEGHATLTDDGNAVIESPGAPEDLVATLHMFAKLTARSAAKKREDGLPPWPARITRWRGPGRGE